MPKINITPLPQKNKIIEQNYFLVTSEVRTRMQKIMSDTSDSFVKDQVILTSFIGEQDDILVVLKNGRYLIFDIAGRIIRVENNLIVGSQPFS